jgi:hypothetical protein
MSNYIIVELARDPDNSEEWFYTGRSFIATATTDDIINEIISPYVSYKDNVLVNSCRHQCDKEFGNWQGIEIHKFPNLSLKPNLINEKISLCDTYS